MDEDIGEINILLDNIRYKPPEGNNNILGVVTIYITGLS